MLPAVSVALLPSQLPAHWAQSQPLAVVIDTLRFTSTACTALASGARSIRVVSQIDQALALAATLAKRAAVDNLPPPLLCGERNCVRIEGFDLGNSPAEYTLRVVERRDLIFSTTNGTLAVEAAAAARQVLLGSLLNRAALSGYLQHWAGENAAQEPRLWIICAGTDGQVALEDVVTAGAIIEQLDWPRANDAAWLACQSWQAVKPAQLLSRQFELAHGGANLIRAGFGEDLQAVLRVDSLDVVPGSTAPGRFEVLTFG